MDTRTSVLAARDEFEQKLKEFVSESERHNVHVFETGPGVLWAEIGTEKFRGVSSTTRQKQIWEYLNKSLSSDALPYCWGVQCMDVSEYREFVLRQISGSVGSFTNGFEKGDASNA